jgi:hypothetical protein
MHHLSGGFGLLLIIILFVVVIGLASSGSKE